MKRFVSASVLFACCVALVRCSAPPPVEEQPELSPEEAAVARRTIVAWLECEECNDGEFDAVRELGQTATPILEATLREGPSPASRELFRRELEARHAELVTYAQDHPEAAIESSVEEFVEMYIGNYEAMYRVRSAQALAAIGGTGTRQALEAAMASASRSDVREAIAASIERLDEP